MVRDNRHPHRASNWKINTGVFSRLYRFDPDPLCVVYHTPSQTVAILEGDSAEVWERVFSANGNTSAAHEYILQNGHFQGDLREESLQTLDAFGDQLRASHFLVDEASASVQPDTASSSLAPASVEEVLNNPEHMVGQIMADHHVLYDLTLELSYRCNEQCIHCYLPDAHGTRELGVAQLDKLLGEFTDLGGMKIYLTGGEIMVRTDLCGILRVVQSHRLVTSLASNLTLLDDAILDRIMAIYPRSVACSIYSARADIHDAITRVPGSHARSLEAIRRLRSAGVPVVIKTPLMDLSAPHWRETEELAQGLGCCYQIDLAITAQNDGGLRPIGRRVTNRKLLEEIFASSFFNLHYNGEALATMTGPSEEAGLCGAGACGLSMSPDGTVNPCIGMTWPLGQWPEASLKQIWESAPFFHEWGALKARDAKGCANCSDFAFCSRCPGSWKAETGDHLKPTPYTCMLASVWASVQRSGHGK